MEEIKPIDHLGICRDFDDIWEYVVLGNSEDFLNRFEKIYGIKREEQLIALNKEYKKDKSNKNLKTIIDRLDELPFNKGRIYIKSHNNNEPFVQIESNVRNRKVDLVYSFGSNTPSVDKDILENICDAAVRAGAEQINLYIPFIPYQREDKKDKGRVPITASRFLQDLENHCAGKLGRIATFDLHAGQAQGFINRPVDNLYASTIFARYVKSKQFTERFGVEYDRKKFVVDAPDAGTYKRGKEFAGLLDCDFVIIEKEERKEHGIATIGEANEQYLIDKVKGKYIIVIDDMFDTGGTYFENYEYLMKIGAKAIYGCMTHGLFNATSDEEKLTTAEEKIRDHEATIITTDTITTDDVIPRISEYYEQNKDIIVPLTITPFYAKVMMANRLGLNASVSRIIQMEKKLVETRSNINMCRYMI